MLLNLKPVLQAVVCVFCIWRVHFKQANHSGELWSRGGIKNTLNHLLADCRCYSIARFNFSQRFWWSFESSGMLPCVLVFPTFRRIVVHHFQSQTIEEVLLLKHCLLDVHKISTPPTFCFRNCWTEFSGTYWRDPTLIVGERRNSGWYRNWTSLSAVCNGCYVVKHKLRCSKQFSFEMLSKKIQTMMMILD